MDEFHHTAAPTYQKLLEYYKPRILLGLTATPERMDGKSILPYFNNRIAAEMRLPDAIDRKLLSPFQYFGVTDTIDLENLKWRAGGYDKTELSNLYTISGMIANRRADAVVTALLKYVTDIDDVKGLGFCLSVDHAKFMSEYFNGHGIPSMVLTGNTPDEERKAAKQRLVAFDFLKPATVREGVKYLPVKSADLFFVTLNKSDKDYSPTTMYNDYSINNELFHWQSQSTTAENSPTGQRYIRHREKGSRVLLFVREFKTDRISRGAAAYTYLGAAEYVSHEGSRPMNITWKLDQPIPAKFSKKTNKLVVG